MVNGEIAQAELAGKQVEANDEWQARVSGEKGGPGAPTAAPAGGKGGPAPTAASGSAGSPAKAPAIFSNSSVDLKSQSFGDRKLTKL
eukprot:5745133-Alexandrium_andersonii.AAC.1